VKELTSRVLKLPGSAFSRVVLREAAREAIQSLKSGGFGSSYADDKLMATMSKTQRKEFIQQKRDQAIENLLRRNEAPTITIKEDLDSEYIKLGLNDVVWL
jgi:hypothetical protein